MKKKISDSFLPAPLLSCAEGPTAAFPAVLERDLGAGRCGHGSAVESEDTRGHTWTHVDTRGRVRRRRLAASRRPPASVVLTKLSFALLGSFALFRIDHGAFYVTGHRPPLRSSRIFTSNAQNQLRRTRFFVTCTKVLPQTSSH